MIQRNDQPIGLFDSGIGGLSVARRVMEQLPHENTVYFGDSARVPYGSKSPETVRQYTREAVSFLDRHNVKLIIIACNTASAVALEFAQSISDTPVIGVIHAGAEMAVAQSRTQRIGVIGTTGTVRSQAYDRAIRQISPTATVAHAACPLLVGFAEEGLIHHAATQMIVEEYLAPLLHQSVDTIVMGCTHYPILEPALAKVCGASVTLVDPGIATAQHAHSVLAEVGMLNSSENRPTHSYFLSDLPHTFVEVGERFLGGKIEQVQRISLESLVC